MIARASRWFSVVAVCLCVATILAQALTLGFFWSTGRLNRSRVARMVAMARGIDLAPSAPESSAATTLVSAPSSLADVEAARAIQVRQLEMRELAVTNSLNQMRFEKNKLDEEMQRFTRALAEFKRQLNENQADTIARGNENARLLLESIKPKQSKELIMKMLEAEEIDEVVALFSAMPIAKRAKIAAEFRTEDEADKLDEILRRIRQGLPESALIEQTEQQLERPPATAAPQDIR